MTSRHIPEKFLVAFSLAGEQRPLVRAIAEATERQTGFGSVFFDEWFEAYLAGDDADLKLQDIYGRRSVLAVVCLSGQYGGKPWTLAEHSAIRARVMKVRADIDEREKLGVLPIRVGQGDVKGILFNTIVPDVCHRTPEKTAELIVERLRLVSTTPIPSAPSLTALPSRPTNAIVVPPGGPERVGLHQELARIFPKPECITIRAAELGIVDLPGTDDRDGLWEDVLRQACNCQRDIRELLALALREEPANKFLLKLYR